MRQWIRLIGAVAVLMGLTHLTPAAAPDKGTHTQVATVAVKGANNNKLQTLSITPKGEIVALVGQSRYTPAKSAEVQVFDAAGKPLHKWTIEFAGQSINAGPDGNVYVAGDGQIARYSSDGKLLAKIDIPHIAEALKNQDELKKRAQASIDDDIKSYQEDVAEHQKTVETLEKKKADELTAAEKQQLRQAKQQVQIYEQILKSAKAKSLDSEIRSITNRIRIINAIAVTPKDVFIACGELKGWGYGVWRMDHDFKNPTQVLKGLGGCCGQMDIQAVGDTIVVAENTKHRVGRYDRTGKSLDTFGKRGTDTTIGCFGGCCNPMNVRIGTDGGVYTAESEGVVKHFDAQGKFVGIVGTATLKGGCKNVAVAVSPDGNHVYFCDQPGSQIIVLKRSATTGTSGQ
jgi:hypothetical protein